MARDTKIQDINFNSKTSPVESQTLAEFEQSREQSLQALKLANSQELYNTQKKILKEYYATEERLIKSKQNAEIKHLAKVKKLEKEIADAKDKGAKNEVKKLQEQIKLLDKIKKYRDAQEKSDAKQQAEAWKSLKDSASNTLFRKGTTLSERFGALNGMNFGDKLDTVVSGLASLAQKLDSTISSIASYQSKWDTRLTGSNSSYNGLVSTTTSIVGFSPYITQSAMIKNIDTAIETGIAYNIEQRAFLQTISDKIATTFNAFDSNLLQIIRIQQADSTASRLGMEAGMTSFLNSMYQNTEYMKSLYGNVTGNLYNASSLLGSSESVGFEYTIQKWLGSLYSVGMSSNTIQSLSSALGMLGSGDVSGLNSSAVRNLLIMGAGQANLNYGDLFNNLNTSNANKLLGGIVQYLGGLNSSGNNITKSKLASVFGVNISDLKAAANLSSSLAGISSYGSSNANALKTLTAMTSTIGSRTNIGEMMTNMLSNLQYTSASGIASDPVLYAIWAASGILDSLAGGIPISNTTVADLMRLGTVGTSLVSGLFGMLGNSGGAGFNTLGMLTSILSSGNAVTARGSGLNNVKGSTVSLSSYIGNTDTSSLYASTIASNQESNQQMVEATGEDSSEYTKDIRDNVQLIYDLLSSNSLHVTIDKYGLTAWEA